MIREKYSGDGSGFTLMELLATLAVASILTALAVPSFKSLAVSSRLSAQTYDVIGAMNLARSEAIKRNGSVSFCRATSATATSCATSAGDWAYWIVRSAAGTVIRRGTVERYGNSIVVSSTLTNDTALFGSDGLARTGGVLISEHEIDICASNMATDNVRRVVMGAGSRMSTETLSEGC